eukprot:11750670-Karenia_brevis.AAC.1
MEILPPSMLQPQTDWTNQMHVGKQTWMFFHHPCCTSMCTCSGCPCGSSGYGKVVHPGNPRDE